MSRILALLLLLAALPLAHSQIAATRRSGTVFASLTDVALLLGYSVTEGAGSLTIRTPRGVLTVFDGSPDGLWTAAGSGGAEDQSFAASVFREGEGESWFAPLDLFQLFGILALGDALELPGGRRVTLALPAAAELPALERYQLVDLGNEVSALRYYAPGSLGADTVSLLLFDLGMLALVLPERQAQLDARMSEFQGDRPLFFLVTALAEASWETSMSFSQGDETFEARYPFRLRLLQGEAGRVAPGDPAAGVILLPETFNLHKPLTVTWQGVAVTVAFRR